MTTKLAPMTIKLILCVLVISESSVNLHNEASWQLREQYLESQIAELKRELKQKQGENATSTAAQQKQEVSTSKSGAVAANSNKDGSDSRSAPAPAAPMTLFLGERHGLRLLQQRPFAFGSLHEAPEVDKTSSSSGWMAWPFTSQREVVQAAVEPARPRSSANKVSLLAVRKGRRQDWERTEIAALKEGRQAIFLGESFGTLENQDITQEKRLQQEDKLARVHARSDKVPRSVTKKALEERRKTDVSGFWGNLENEDRTIQHSLNENGDDLDDYLRLTKEQNDRVSRATATLAQDNLNLRFNLKRNDHSFEARTIHDEFQNYEQHDKKTIGEIKANPDLQMLQLQHKHHQHP